MGVDAEGMVAPCSVPSIRPCGRPCTLWHEEYFSKLRARDGLRDDFINTGWNFDSFESGGGKGGTVLAYLGTSFVVKELSQGDHLCLLDITSSYYEHLSAGHSRLSAIYLHYRDDATGRVFFVMRNELGPGPFQEMYDLKGCDDDRTLMASGKAVNPVRKRIWNIIMWGGTCCWTEDRVTYHRGKVNARKLKLHMTEEQRAQVLSELKRDTDWLAKMNLMDYSLLVGIRKGPPGFLEKELEGRRPVARKQDCAAEVVHFLGIVDFLQKWNLSKKVAQVIKILERNKATIHPEPYGTRFYEHFCKNIVVLE